MLRALRKGEMLGLLIDQDTRVQSVFVPFFGQPAATPRAAADLALRTGAAALVVLYQREGTALPADHGGGAGAPDRRRRARRGRAHRPLTERIEAAIRAAPRAVGLDAPAVEDETVLGR